jgi:hypothetical protein
MLYRQRHKIENMFGRLKSLPPRRRGTGAVSQPATTDARAQTFMSAICIAATLCFWL